MICFCILIQAILFMCLDENTKIFLITNYIIILSCASLFMGIVFIGILLYLHSNQLQETYEELDLIDSIKCPKRDEVLLSPIEYQKKNANFYVIYNVIDYCSYAQAINDHLRNFSYPINKLFYRFLDIFTGVKEHVVYYGIF